MAVKVIVEADKQALLSRLKVLIQQVADGQICSPDDHVAVFSGGSLVGMLAGVLPDVKTDWSKWRFFFCDERVVPFADADSTFGCYKAQLMPQLGLKEEHFVVIDPALSAEQAAMDYSSKLSKYFGETLPEFDLLLLGMGPDGHTCSLFPGHKVVEEKGRWVAEVTDSPKPPPCRVTLTLPVLNNARLAVFPISGREKADTVLKVLHPGVGETLLPAARVKPSKGDVIWLLDSGAASLLPK
ncbi:unnamed protein product [Ixodes hexagonus]